MDFRQWIDVSGQTMLRNVRNYVKDNDVADDLFQNVCLQLLEKPKKIDEVPDDQKLYFFIRVIKNNYHSKTSPWAYSRLKHQKRNVELKEELTHIEDQPYEEDTNIPPIEWVREQLDNEELFTWYQKDLWNLWVELGSLVGVSKKTTIPSNTISRHVRQINDKLKELWLEVAN
jgi:DNA-directed RNA polymerase specialized sigma24 family protein